MRSGAALLVGGGSLCAVSLAIPASGSMPIPATTGGFGENTCQQCHEAGTAGEPPGELTLEGVPETYVPGMSYQLTITLAHPGLRGAGFQISAREDGINMSSGTDAGFLAPVDERTRTSDDDRARATYVQHTGPGTAGHSPGQASWTIEWVAPDGLGTPVVFHLAAVAADGDGTPLGDAVYAMAAHSR